MTDEPMQDRDEVQKAHDLLLAVILEGYGNSAMAHSIDVLCWCLGHDHNHRFSTLLLQLEKLLEDLGIKLERLPQMHYPGKEE